MKNIVCLTMLAIITPASADDKISYPETYRQWSHVKTLTLHKGHALANPFEGIHHVYANSKAVQGLKLGTYPDGAKIAFDLLESNTANHASAEGERILLGLMVKDRKRYATTGGWGFEAWQQNSRTKRLTSDSGTSCYTCHTSQKDSDYVFSQWRK